MALIDKVYKVAPTAIQDLMTTGRGFQLRRLRYTSHTWQTLEFLTESQFWTLEQFEAYQLERLRRLVEHACRYSPYYQQRYAALKINAGLLKDLSDIQLLPIVSKEEFRQNNDRFVSTHVDRREMWVAYTSGTTGTPLTAYHTHRNMQERIASMERLYRWYNPKPWRKRASFTGRLMVDSDRNDGPFHRVNLAFNQQLYSSHHLIAPNLDRYIDELASFGPEQIDGIASPIYVVADHIIRTDRIGDVQPKVIFPSSETIWPHIRERIERGFACNVANQYGSQEGAPLAYECPEGGFHICPESGIFEILRPDNTPCEPGELGRLIVTSFLSGTPLIRYDIGDIAAWRAGTCSCGRHMPMLLAIEGRVDDMFFTLERGIVPRVDSAFKSMPNSIIATQVAQMALDHFEVRIAPDPNLYRPEHGSSLVTHLHDYLGQSVHIEVKIVPEIRRTAAGKLCAMVNECEDVEVRSAIAEGWNTANVNSWSTRGSRRG